MGQVIHEDSIGIGERPGMSHHLKISITMTPIRWVHLIWRIKVARDGVANSSQRAIDSIEVRKVESTQLGLSCSAKDYSY